MSIKKEFISDYRICRVTFILPKGIGKNVKKAQVVGEFNGWSQSATPMKKMRDGTFSAIIELPLYREYQFRYLLEDKMWMNDSAADRFVPTPFGDSENCVLTTYNDSHIKMIKAYQVKPRSTASNAQPPVASFPDKSPPTETLFSILNGPLQTVAKAFLMSSLSLKSLLQNGKKPKIVKLV